MIDAMIPYSVKQFGGPTGLIDARRQMRAIDKSFDIGSRHGVWRCSGCGEMAGPLPNTQWRWAGDHWQHRCVDPTGHEPAMYFPYTEFSELPEAPNA